MGDYEDTFHPNGTDGDDVEETPSQGGWFGKDDDDDDRRKKKKEKKGCFLTSAACDYHGLPDDCYELETLRSFRDDFMGSFQEGKDLVDEYYQVAPSLVPLVAEEHNAVWVWGNIRKAVAEIERGTPYEALITYKAMVRELQHMLDDRGH